MMSAPEAIDPWSPAVHPLGRSRELRLLESSLRNGRNVAVLGANGIGKTSLLRAVEASLKASAIPVAMVSAAGPAGLVCRLLRLQGLRNPLLARR